jgi:hypothetical protein
MAVKWPAANGNWSTAANWNDGTKPTTGDTVHADSRTITIDENVDLGAGSKLTTETRSGGAAGGGFTFSGDYTITVADLVSNVTSACLTYTGSGTGAVVNAIDGVRVTTPDGWWLLRASNTQDVLVVRAESRDEAGLARLLAEVDAQLALSGVSRGPQVAH